MRALQFLTPHHDNMGDNAQAYCINKMLSSFFGIENVVKFQLPDTSIGLQQVSKEDIIFLGSGGYLGDLWIRGEEKRREIIQKCHDNIIISFPQTVAFYSDAQAKISKDIYKNHPRLYLSARDPESYVLAKSLFPSNPIFQLPDPVFTISYNGKSERKGILCIFRNDKEDFLKGKKNSILEQCKKIDSLVTVTDTEALKDGHREPIKNIEKELFSFLDFISKYRFVVTDRFHGTVFAAVAGTPCLALPTINHKVISSSYWHKYFQTGTVICDEVSFFSDQIQNMPKPFVYNPSKAIGLYHQVISSVKATGTVSNLNSIEEVLSFRRSIRRWRKTLIPDNILIDIIQTGVYAPSGSNAQCVRFKIIKDSTQLAAISKKFRWDKEAPPAIILVGYDFGVEQTINFNHRNPTWEILKYQDVAAAMQNMLLYSESIGLSCCWLSLFPSSIQTFLSSINIKDDNIEYISAIAIGIAKPNSQDFEHGGSSIARKLCQYYIR